ncbi:MAG: hypothetical protein HYZ37_18730 [Candidatus Solibacter usitatus]|nr:hypothetical protein [Candidatus Solibacter usitatus]
MSASVAFAQRGGGDWMTSAYDAQRSSWVRSDGKISKETMSKPGFELVWKMKFENAARQLNTVTPPALLDFYIGYRGFRTLGFYGASSDRVIGIDLDLARTEWQKNFSGPGSAAGTLQCPGGLTSAVTRPTTTAYPANFGAGGRGRGGAAKSGVGLPHEGAVTLQLAPQQPFAPPPPPQKKQRGANAAAAAAAAAAPNPFGPRVQYVMALTGLGKLHALYVSNGEEPNPAMQFLPANANAHGLIAFDGTVYASTSNGCGGVDNGVWALDLGTKNVTHWKSSSSVAGTAGPAAGPDGTLYAAAGTELTALAAKTLAAQGSYKTGGAQFTSSPVVFEHKGKNLIAATTDDGRLHLLDAASLNNALDKSAPFSSANYAAGSVTSWQDPAGTRWVLAAAGGSGSGEIKNGAVVAFKVVDKNGVPSLEKGWVSRDMASPLPPVVINGVVFALASGEFRSDDSKITAAQRAQRSTNAVLYALDPATGKELWSSGKTITSFVHSGGMSAGGSRIHVGTYDGTQYAFSFPIEH